MWQLSRQRRSTAALEFALIAPVLVALLAAVFDIARALIVWEELTNAAQAIVVSAEKLSVTPGSKLTSLTYTQMMTAMTTIYTSIPGLALGTGKGIFPGSYSVTLSEVEYYPLCAKPNLSGCAPQTPYTLWTAFMFDGAAMNNNPALRPCAALTPVAAFPNTSANYFDMLMPTAETGAQPMVMSPHLVADLRYQFTPFFPFFMKSYTFYASAVAPTPLGDTTQLITTTPQGGLLTCVVP